MPTLGSYLLIGALAAVVTFAMTPIVARIARRMGWVYLPNDRTVHRKPLPDIGGLAMLVGLIAALVTASFLDEFDAVFTNNSEPLGVLIAAVIIYGIGFFDDVRELSAPAKVTGTVIAGLALVWFGVVMFSFRLPYLGGTVLSDDLKPLITVLWLIGLTQAINLIDGLDGLAAGVVAIGAFAFFLYSQELSELGLLDSGNVGPLIAIIAVGVCVGFLPHNFNPARIMMGDGGALLLGLLLAVATSVVGGRADPFENEFPGTTYFFLAPIAIPLLILGVPVLDTLFAIVRRATGRRALASADKGHLHHRLMNLGHGHRRSVLILWMWTALLSGFVLYPTLTEQNPAYLPFGIVAIAIVLFTVLHPSVRRRRREDRTPPRGIEVTAPAADAPGPDTPTADAAAVDGAAVDVPALDDVTVDGAMVDAAAVDEVAVDSGDDDGVQVAGAAVDGGAVDTAAVDDVAANGDEVAVDSGDDDGVQVAGAAVDGGAVDTAAVDDVAANGDEVAVDSGDDDGVQVAGAAVDGGAVDTAAVDDVAANGDEVAVDVVAVDGVVGDDAAGDRVAVDGVAVDAAAVDGMVVDEVAVDLAVVDSAPVDAVAVDGVVVDSVAVDGVAVDAALVDGVAVGRDAGDRVNADATSRDERDGHARVVPEAIGAAPTPYASSPESENDEDDDSASELPSIGIEQ